MKTKILLLFFYASTVLVSAQSNVVPIDWSKFKKAPPTDEASLILTQNILNANKYMLNTWWNQVKKFDTIPADQYLNFGGIGEHNIRPCATEAECLAISLKLGVYRADYTGVSVKEATLRLTKLISSLAYRHKAVSEKGWGNVWQSALWTGSMGTAAWLMWPDLDANSQKMVQQVIEYEANRFNEYKVPYYKDRNGSIKFSGDTKCEENAWNSFVLDIATAMMPTHKNYSVWMNKNIELMLSAFAKPSDITKADIYHGKPLSEWLNGSNSFEDGTLVNHSRVHPEYIASGLFEFSPARIYPLAGKPVPKAGAFNVTESYSAFTQRKFIVGEILPDTKPNNGRVLAPGGVIYSKATSEVNDPSDIYFPQGNDWGLLGRVNYVNADAVASAVAASKAVQKNANFWLTIHAQKVLNCQKRFDTGQTYKNASECNYMSREEASATQTARAYLVRWLYYQGAVRFSNEKY
ncbi:MAG: hypothetical protein Q8928_10050 [Bacteroidota bacterium]|nr:hypothetical protein [Bacteroidota bacterium]